MEWLCCLFVIAVLEEVSVCMLEGAESIALICVHAFHPSIHPLIHASHPEPIISGKALI